RFTHARSGQRRSFSNALNFCRSAIAALVRSPWRYCPFCLPRRPPLPLALAARERATSAGHDVVFGLCLACSYAAHTQFVQFGPNTQTGHANVEETVKGTKLLTKVSQGRISCRYFGMQIRVSECNDNSCSFHNPRHRRTL